MRPSFAGTVADMQVEPFADVPGAYPRPYEDIACLPDGRVAGYASKLFVYSARGRKQKRADIFGGYSVVASSQCLYVFGLHRKEDTTTQAVSRISFDGTVERALPIRDGFAYGCIALSPDARKIAGFIDSGEAFSIDSGLLTAKTKKIAPSISAVAWLGDRPVFATGKGVMLASPAMSPGKTAKIRASALAGPADASWVCVATDRELVVLDPALATIAKTKLPGVARIWVDPAGTRLMASVPSGYGKGLYHLPLDGLDDGALGKPKKVPLDEFAVLSGCFSTDGATFFFGQDSVMSKIVFGLRPSTTATKKSAKKSGVVATGLASLLEQPPAPADALARFTRALDRPHKRVSVPAGLGSAPQSLTSWLGLGPQLDRTFSMPSASWVPSNFTRLLTEARHLLPMLMANAFPITSQADPVLLHVSPRSVELLMAFHDEPLMHSITKLADSIESGALLLAATRHHAAGGALDDPGPMLRALAGHVHCVARFEDIDELMVGHGVRQPDWTSQGLTEFRRSTWILELLDGEEEDADLDLAAELYWRHAEPLEVLTASRRGRHFWDRPGDALYWLLHLFLCNEQRRLADALERSQRSRSAIVRSAAKTVAGLETARRFAYLRERRAAFIALD